MKEHLAGRVERDGDATREVDRALEQRLASRSARPGRAVGDVGRASAPWRGQLVGEVEATVPRAWCDANASVELAAV
jgi:hypothetical protein